MLSPCGPILEKTKTESLKSKTFRFSIIGLKSLLSVMLIAVYIVLILASLFVNIFYYKDNPYCYYSFNVFAHNRV